MSNTNLLKIVLHPNHYLQIIRPPRKLPRRSNDLQTVYTADKICSGRSGKNPRLYISVLLFLRQKLPIARYVSYAAYNGKHCA